MTPEELESCRKPAPSGPNVKPRRRRCLCCLHDFNSQGPHNRICPRCQRRRTEDGFLAHREDRRWP